MGGTVVPLYPIQTLTKRNQPMSTDTSPTLTLIAVNSNDDSHIYRLDHQFNKPLNKIEDLLERFAFFIGLDLPAPAHAVHHLNIVEDHDCDHSVYYPRRQTLRVNVPSRSRNDLMPSSTWFLTPDSVIREVIENGIVKRKVWECYSRLAGKDEWQVTSTDHSRNPLYLHRGTIPRSGWNFRRELEATLKDIQARFNSPTLDRFHMALRFWTPKSTFGEDDMRRLIENNAMVVEIKKFMHVGEEAHTTADLSWWIETLDILGAGEPQQRSFAQMLNDADVAIAHRDRALRS